MVVKSFIQSDFGLRPVEVEVVVTSGLPTITILGLPDRLIQESVKRIQTAIRSQGFELPRAKQILVNLWPREHKKSSLGLDLAIALAILQITEQVQMQDLLKENYVYGELSLEGKISAPKDIYLLNDYDNKLITGQLRNQIPFSVYMMQELKQQNTNLITGENTPFFLRPQFRYPSYHKDVAELLQITCAGEHSVLLAGPPGSGKTSFAESVLSFLTEPNQQQIRELMRLGHDPQSLIWRPIVQPHHSATVASLIGGSAPLRPGECDACPSRCFSFG